MNFVFVFIVIVFAITIIGFITHFLFAAKVFRLVNRTFEASLDQLEQQNQLVQSELKKDYQCDLCGAQLNDLTDISLSDDFIKCLYCQSWSSIHS